MLSVAKAVKWPVTLVLILILAGQMGGFGVLQAAATPAPSTVILQQPAVAAPVAPGTLAPSALASSTYAYFAKYMGIDGESADRDHLRWTDIESFKWGASLEVVRLGQGGQIPGRATADAFELTLFYDKSASKMLEATLTGRVIPMLVVELTTTTGDGMRAPFLKYEFKNVMITRYDVTGTASSGLLPMVNVANTFEQVKVTYTEYDAAGKVKSVTTVQWNAAAGA